MFLIDLLFPKFCLNCGYVGAYICPSCIKKLSPIKVDVCFYCKKPSLFGLTHQDCIKTDGIDGFLTIYQYNPVLKKILKNIKYRLATQVWEEFKLMVTPDLILKLDCYKKISSKIYIQSIPLSESRYRERGFNQASLISIFFQKFLSYPIVDLLNRKGEPLAQAQIKSRRARRLNLKGTFGINQNHNIKNIILVDDVVTSGATMIEATKVLKGFGIKKVFVLSLARG